MTEVPRKPTFPQHSINFNNESDQKGHTKNSTLG